MALVLDPLHGAGGAQADDLVAAFVAVEQFAESVRFCEHQFDHLDSPAKGIGVAPGEHVFERLGHGPDYHGRISHWKALPLSQQKRAGRRTGPFEAMQNALSPRLRNWH